MNLSCPLPGVNLSLTKVLIIIISLDREAHFLHHHQVHVVPAVISHLSGPEKLYTQNQQLI